MSKTVNDWINMKASDMWKPQEVERRQLNLVWHEIETLYMTEMYTCKILLLCMTVMYRSFDLTYAAVVSATYICVIIFPQLVASHAER
jgi:hypothetical protein